MNPNHVHQPVDDPNGRVPRSNLGFSPMPMPGPYVSTQSTGYQPSMNMDPWGGSSATPAHEGSAYTGRPMAGASDIQVPQIPPYMGYTNVSGGDPPPEPYGQGGPGGVWDQQTSGQFYPGPFPAQGHQGQMPLSGPHPSGLSYGLGPPHGSHPSGPSFSSSTSFVPMPIVPTGPEASGYLRQHKANQPSEMNKKDWKKEMKRQKKAAKMGMPVGAVTAGGLNVGGQGGYALGPNPYKK